MSQKQKKMLIRIIIAGVLYAALLIWSTTYFYEDLIEDNLPEPILYFVPFIIAGYDIVIKAFKNMAHGQVFDENFLMLIASRRDGKSVIYMLADAHVSSMLSQGIEHILE